MFVIAVIAVPVLEVFVFVEVGQAIGWLVALALLLGTSVLGARLLRIKARLAVERLSLAVSERRPAAAATIDGALELLGAALIAVPGFVTDILGGVLLLPPAQRFARRRISQRYARRMMSFLARTPRFAPRARQAAWADAEATAIDDDRGRLDR
jgi:UPF0716 protein FxsA